ncbi:MAG TPA: PQQ-binding-like beta-propeller repeat protein, partial [Blastocatellia bacterium]
MNPLLILLLIINSITPVTTADRRTDVWPGFRGAGDSHAAARELPLEWADGRNVAWNVALPGYGQSSPVVRRDKIFLTAVEGANKEKLLVFSRDLKRGRRLWLKEFPATFTMKDANTVSKAAPTPAVDERRLYVFFESGDLFAFDHKGNPQWRRKLAEEYGAYKTNHGLGSSIALTDKAVITLVAHGGPSYLLAVDKQTGKNLWKSDLKSGGGWSSPIITTHQNRRQI